MWGFSLAAGSGGVAGAFPVSTGASIHTVDPDSVSYMSTLFSRYLEEGNFDALMSLAADDPVKFTASIPSNGILQEEVMWNLLRNPDTTGDQLIKLYRTCKIHQLHTPFMLVAALATSVYNKTVEIDRVSDEMKEVRENWVPRDVLWSDFKKYNYWGLLTVEGWSGALQLGVESLQSFFVGQPVYFSTVTYHAVEKSITAKYSVEAFKKLTAFQKHINTVIKEHFEEKGWERTEVPVTSAIQTNFPAVRVLSVSRSIHNDLVNERFSAVRSLRRESPALFDKCVPASGVLQERVMWELLLDESVSAKQMIRLHRFLEENNLATRFTLLAALAKSIGQDTYLEDQPFSEMEKVLREWLHQNGLFFHPTKEDPGGEFTSSTEVFKFIKGSIESLSPYAFLGGTVSPDEKVGWYARALEDAMAESLIVYSDTTVHSYFVQLKAKVHEEIKNDLVALGWTDTGSGDI